MTAKRKYPAAKRIFRLTRLLIVTGERDHHHWRGSTHHDQDYLGLNHQRHRRRPLRFVEDRSGGGTCQWWDFLGLEASLKGSMVVFAFDYYFCDGDGGGGERREEFGG